MRRYFPPGSEWLYYKIYCGYETADELLSEVIGKLSKQLINKKLIDSWFFIRYADPNPHIRLRFHFDDISNIGDVIVFVENTLRPFLETGQVNRIMTDTYKREIERYGETTIELCEKLFFHNSVMVTDMLTIIEDIPEKKTYRWLFALKAIDAMLSDFGYTLDKRHDLSKRLADAFGQEFRINESTIQQFSGKYRTSKNMIFKFMHNDDEQARELYKLINIKSEDTKSIVRQLMDSCLEHSRLEDIVRSLIHMTMNRIFLAQQRKHEVILYGFLERYYRSEVAKKKYCK
ncbi:MAG: thiopeptide-type bacteriocin biosynthesis protein [Bacteroidales bacterium]|nr:thiopeptide-type bacteriocin biosynthesis protein [Bacteroidales bacterium]